MMEINGSVRRITELGKRDAAVLENGAVRVMIDDMGGMIPELSGRCNGAWINTHWTPWFRANSGVPYNDAEHGSFWKANLLYQIAGNFACVPNFGPGHIVDGVAMPPHGWTANKIWNHNGSGRDEASGAIWAHAVLESPEETMPLSFSRLDMIVPGQAVHYASLRVYNRGAADMEICAAWHNTVGAPFLAPHCRISGPAKNWMTPPPGGEFDDTTRLESGAAFSSLSHAPLRAGGKADLSIVSAPIGFTDFVTGAIPLNARTGWFALVNPYLKMLYMPFFTGPAAAEEDDIILYFNELWMQYGGRLFTPWAAYDGGADLTYCLGMENAVAAFAYGLDYARKTKTLLGNPVTVTIPARSSRTLRFGTLAAPYETGLEDGVGAVEAEETRLVCKGKGTAFFSADPSFRILKTLERLHTG
jgi:hypothetical protein